LELWEKRYALLENKISQRSSKDIRLSVIYDKYLLYVKIAKRLNQGWIPGQFSGVYRQEVQCSSVILLGRHTGFIVYGPGWLFFFRRPPDDNQGKGYGRQQVSQQ